MLVGNMAQGKTTILYLIGRPGTGKYTISQELAKAGYVVCDNQLINNPIFELLNYDGFMDIPEFAWEVIGKIRNNIFDFLVLEGHNNYVLTNCLYEVEEDYDLYAQVEQMATRRGSLFVPVKLLIDQAENLQRITQPSRRLKWKSIDPQDIYTKDPLISVSHPHLLELDVTALSAKEVAEQILTHVIKVTSKISL